MKKIIFAGLVGFASISFFACSNGDYDANPNTNNSNVGNPLLNNGGGNNNTTALTTGTWKITEYTLTTSSGSSDLLGLVDDCEKDDLYTFQTDKTILRDEGATKCSPDNPQTKTDGTWDINGDKFTGTNDEGSQTWDIVTLDNSTFKITATKTLNGENATATQVYSRP